MEREDPSTWSRTGRVRDHRSWRLVVASVLLAAGSALAVSLVRTPTYEAQVEVSPLSRDAPLPTDPQLEAEETLIEGPAVAELVARTLLLAGDPPPVRATRLDGGRTWSMTVRTSSPATARAVLDAFVQAYRVERAAQLADGRIDWGGTVRIAEPTWASSSPVAPRTVLLTLVAGAVGLVIGLLGLVIGLLGRLATGGADDVVRDASELAQFGYRVLGTVPLDRSIGVDVSTPRRAQEVHPAFQLLSSRVVALGANVVEVVACSPGDGATAVASELAVACAHLGRPVVAVDADVRSPRLGDLFATPRHPGLLDLLEGDEIDFVIRPLDVGAPQPVGVIASGGVARDHEELFLSTRTPGLVAELGRRGLVIVDSPAVLAFDDALQLARSTDGVVVVVRAGATTLHDVGAAIARLTGAGGSIAGFVLNGVEPGGAADVLADRSVVDPSSRPRSGIAR